MSNKTHPFNKKCLNNTDETKLFLVHFWTRTVKVFIINYQSFTSHRLSLSQSPSFANIIPLISLSGGIAPYHFCGRLRCGASSCVSRHEGSSHRQPPPVRTVKPATGAARGGRAASDVTGAAATFFFFSVHPPPHAMVTCDGTLGGWDRNCSCMKYFRKIHCFLFISFLLL